jgi:YfiH family protein
MSNATQTQTTDIAKVSALSALADVRHAFFTRTGGASVGLYGSNNCAFGSDDDRANVAKNRAACQAQLGASALVTVKQRHTADVVVVDQPWSWDDAPVADALVTARPGIAVGILTADCTPVLLADATAGVVAAAHAGWRGAFDGVLENTVGAMTKLGAERARIIAAVGPCIGQASYEVGPEFVARFIERDLDYGRYFTAPKSNGHVHFDLPRFAADRLRAADVGTVVVEGSDTCARDSFFFSYRRSVLRGEPDYGRQLSAIVFGKGA